MDIASASDLSDGVVPGDRLTRVCRTTVKIIKRTNAVGEESLNEQIK